MVAYGVLICVLLVTGELEHLFMCLLAINNYHPTLSVFILFSFLRVVVLFKFWILGLYQLSVFPIFSPTLRLKFNLCLWYHLLR